jgi:hypothetical protein
MTDQTPRAVQRKFCPQCGSPNRRTAKVCSQCGYHFKGASPAAIQASESASGNQPQASRKKKGCPDCGTINNIAAKVCIQCGHRFRTRFKQDAPAHAPNTSEPRISPNLEPPLVLPEKFTSPPIVPPQGVTNNFSSTVPTVNNPEGEPAPDIGSEELDTLREQSPENTDPYERLKLSLQRKHRKP